MSNINDFCVVSVKFDDVDFDVELLDTVKLFFEDSKISYRKAVRPGQIHAVKVSENGIEAGSQTIAFYGGLSEKGASYTLTLNKGKKEDKYVIKLSGGLPKKTELERRRSFKRDVRRGTYILFSRLTGKSLPWGVLTGIRPVKIVHELMGQGFDREEILSKMTGYFMLSKGKAVLSYDVASVEKKILDSSTVDSVSLYIGIPFCRSRCLYCSFTSYPIRQYYNLTGTYLDALKKELLAVSELIKEQGLRVQSIYIGGGTPTAISAPELQALLGFIERTFDISCLQEYTLEAGRPDCIDASKLSAIKASAVGRISINPQSMSNETLKLIGREHSKEDFLKAFKLARSMGFDNINTDLIIGLPGENPVIFEESLREISELQPESLTVHTMALKRASRLNTEKKEYSHASEREASEMVDIAQKYATGMGMHPYYLYRQKNMLGNLENIGYCKPGYESVYNVQIMEEKQTIIAAGSGAITKVVWRNEDRIERAFNVKGVEEYITRIDEMITRKRSLFI